MPRVTPNQQYERHQFLYLAWHHFQDIYTLLTASQQWELHRLYHPTEALSESAFAEHLHQATAKEPSLPNRAGKHYRQVKIVFDQLSTALGYDQQDAQAVASQAFMGALAYARREGIKVTPQPAKQAQQQRGNITIRGVARPVPDVRLLSKALVAMALRWTEEEK